MRYRPTGAFTVTNTFSTNNFGEVGLASGTKPLIQRTEVELPGPAGSSATEADNAARAVVLDDASSTNFLLTGNTAACTPRPSGCLLNGNLTPPYISTTEPVRVGASTTFDADVIFTQGGSPSAPTYRFQPLTTVVGPANTGSPATFENTRTPAPDEALINEVGDADLKIASFNVLNYFTTLGDADDDNVGDGGCTPFRDRDGDGNTVSGGCNQRGAWDPQDFERQQSKIVSAINALDADVVGLMEIENSATLGEAADEATNSLVAALNDDAGAGTWAANPSSTELPASGMDVITNAIIFKPASVDRVGQARALGTLSDSGEAFNNAREPIGQVFEADAGGDPFLFVVNHFKSKGSAGPNPGDADSGDGQGASNGSRKLQAAALRDWVADVQTETTSSRSSWRATSTPTPWRTRCRCSTPRATPTWSRSSTTASTPTRSRGCPVRWTTSSSTTRRSTGPRARTSGTSTVASHWRWSTAATTTTALTSTPRVPTGRPTTTRSSWAS